MGQRRDDRDLDGIAPTEHADGQPTLPGLVRAGHRAEASPGGIALSYDLAPGQPLGRYRIERMVGRGAMGEVYAAYDPQLDRRVAIKVLTATYRSAEAAIRLVREAQALAKLDHPNVVTVHDAGELDGRVFLAMRFVEGMTLGEHLSRHQPEAPAIIELFLAAGRGLAAAHRAGLVHRDLKPGNVLVDTQGRVSVTDFGLARSVADLGGGAPPPARVAHASRPDGERTSSLDSDMTQAGAMIGTPAYMSPEQHAGERGSAKSDQFAFCVAMWEALFGRHPFVRPGDDRVNSPFGFAQMISDGILVAPPSGHAVPKWVVAALTRGMARDPVQRWPSMDTLLGALEPSVSGYRVAVVVLAAMATVGVGVAGWLALRPGATPGRRCASEAADRVTTAWTTDHAAGLDARFAASGRAYAEAMATQAKRGLDQYAARWVELATDACTVGRGSDAEARGLAARRATCMDQRLTALRTLVAELTAAGRPELVDNASSIVAGLPDLGDCADPPPLAGTLPPEVAAKLPPLEARLVEVRVLLDAGLFKDALAAAVPLTSEADQLGWPPLRIGAHQAQGEIRLGLLEPAVDDFLVAANLATEHHLGRDAARSFASAVQAAGAERRRDTVATLALLARAAAIATGDPALVSGAQIAYGRALVRTSRYHDAGPLCREAKAEIDARVDATRQERGRARDCLVEALAPMGEGAEVRALLEEGRDEITRLAGADHPAVADYTVALAPFVRADGRADEARAMLEHALAVRERVFGPGHVRVAESLLALADHDTDPTLRQARLARALAIAEDPVAGGLRGREVAAHVHRALALAAGAVGDDAGTRRHFERELALLEDTAGPDSLDVAVLLVNYGQYRTRWDFDGGVAMLTRAVTILERLHDPRLAVASSALALILSQAGRWAEALPILEAAVASVDPARLSPVSLGQMRLYLAQALVEVKGDRARADELVAATRADLVRAGPDGERLLAEVDAWVKRRRRAP